MAEDDGQAVGDEFWAFDVESMSKITGVPPDDDDVTYAVTFNATGPDASAEVEVFVNAPSSPALIITLAMSKLHEAFAAWARVTAGHHIANDDGVPG